MSVSSSVIASESDARSNLILNLLYASSETGGCIEVAYRADMECLEDEKKGHFLRLRILSGSNLNKFSALETGPVCVVRILAYQHGVVQNIDTPFCSTPLKIGCSHTGNPLWDFECGFFIENISAALLDISVWNSAAANFAGRESSWEITDEFLSYTWGCLSAPYMGSALLPLSSAQENLGKTVHQELHISLPCPTSSGIYACSHIQACLRMVSLRTAYIRMHFEKNADTLYRFKVNAQVLSRRFVPIHLKKQVRAARNLASTTAGGSLEGPTAHCMLQVRTISIFRTRLDRRAGCQARDMFGQPAVGAHWLGGDPAQARGAPAERDFNPVWSFAATLRASPSSSLAYVSVQVSKTLPLPGPARPGPAGRAAPPLRFDAPPSRSDAPARH